VVDAGVLIHEGQITYGRLGLRKVVDLGEWWLSEKGLPTPLGVDAVRKDLGLDAAEELKRLLLESIRYAETHREQALGYASRFSRGLPLDDVARFVDMYVNEYTKDMGRKGGGGRRGAPLGGQEAGPRRAGRGGARLTQGKFLTTCIKGALCRSPWRSLSSSRRWRPSA